MSDYHENYVCLRMIRKCNSDVGSSGVDLVVDMGFGDGDGDVGGRGGDGGIVHDDGSCGDDDDDGD